MPEGGETLFIRKNSNIAKRLLRSHKSKKDIQYNGQKKKDKRTMRDFAKGIVIVEVLCGFYYITYLRKISKPSINFVYFVLLYYLIKHRCEPKRFVFAAEWTLFNNASLNCIAVDMYYQLNIADGMGVSNCCLAPTQQLLSYIMTRNSLFSMR